MPQDQGPTRLPLIVSPENRDETSIRDAKLINGYLEKVSEAQAVVYKRPAVRASLALAGGAGMGIYNWNGVLYGIAGGNFYEIVGGVATLKGTVDATGGVYTFTSGLGATPKLFFQNGVKGYTYDSGGGLVQVTDVDFPTTGLCKGVAYVDGTTYVMTTDASILGSAINDATSWDPLNKLVAQIEPDRGVALAKQLIYVVALKTGSCEVFYDAGNATGSPLGRVAAAKVNYGCRTQDSVQELEGGLLWVSQSKSGSIGAAMMDQVKATPISTPAVERLLQSMSYTQIYSWAFRLSGHKFYGVTSVASNLTLVYDTTSQAWAQWTDQGGNYFPICAATDGTNQSPILQHATSGALMTVSTSQYSDQWAVSGALTTIPWDLYTPNFDGGTRESKYLNRLAIIGDQVPGSFLQVRVNDYDFAPTKWTNFRNVDLGQKRPSLTNCGSFRRRAFHLRHRADKPLRLEAVELHLMLGTN